MSKVVKGVGRAIKKVASGIVKGVKKFAKSKFGKIVIAAVAIYFGGAALGAWGGGVGAASGAAAGAGFVGEGALSGIAAWDAAAAAAGASGGAGAAAGAAGAAGAAAEFGPPVWEAAAAAGGEVATGAAPAASAAAEFGPPVWEAAAPGALDGGAAAAAGEFGPPAWQAAGPGSLDGGAATAAGAPSKTVVGEGPGIIDRALGSMKNVGEFFTKNKLAGPLIQVGGQVVSSYARQKALEDEARRRKQSIIDGYRSGYGQQLWRG